VLRRLGQNSQRRTCIYFKFRGKCSHLSEHPLWNEIRKLSICGYIESMKWPNKLVRLDISHAKVAQIQELPNTLTYLDYRDCNFAIWPRIPDTVVELFCNKCVHLLSRNLSTLIIYRRNIYRRANVTAIRANQKKIVATILGEYCRRNVNDVIDWVPMIEQICECL
jgi:hypothetical protein